MVVQRQFRPQMASPVTRHGPVLRGEAQLRPAMAPRQGVRSGERGLHWPLAAIQAAADGSPAVARLRAFGRLAAGRALTSPLQAVWERDEASGIWTDDPDGHTYDPATHVFAFVGELEAAARSSIRQELAAEMTAPQLAAFLDQESRGLPHSDQIEETDDAFDGRYHLGGTALSVMGGLLGGDGGQSEGEESAALDSVVPVATLADRIEISGSEGANTCVIVLMRARMAGHTAVGSIHLSTEELSDYDVTHDALLDLYDKVVAQFEDGDADALDELPECYVVGGEQDEDADSMREYTTLVNAFVELDDTMALVGARLPASPAGGSVDAAIDRDRVRFTRNPEVGGGGAVSDSSGEGEAGDVYQPKLDHDAPVQMYDAGNVDNFDTLKDNIGGAIASGADRFGHKIASSQNVATLAKMFYDPLPWKEAKSVASYKENAGYQTFVRKALDRVEAGAAALDGDLAYWLERTAPNHHGLVVSQVDLTGSEMHDRGLGVAIVIWSASIVVNGDVSEAMWRAVLKPDDRSFEAALLSGEGSVAGQMNSAAELGHAGVRTVDMSATAAHGTMTEYVGAGIMELAEASLRFLRILPPERQTTLEAVAFSFLTGLHDLHDENVKYSGGRPALIDAEVGMQPGIFKDQFKDTGEGNSSSLSNPGFSNYAAREKEVGDQLVQGEGPSRLMAWARQNPDEVIRILKDTVNSLKARIVPIYTEDLFEIKNGLLKAQFRNDEEMEESKLDEGVNILENGNKAGESQGLKAMVDGGWANAGKNNARNDMADDFGMAVIPEFQYQPSSGYVFFHDRVIWRGEKFDDVAGELKARLSGD